MVDTPGTRKSKGGIFSPSSSKNGSRKPPRQASVWKLMPRSAASAARSGMGSTTPKG